MDGQKSSWVDGIPSRAALGLGAALGVGAVGVIGLLFLIPGAMKGQAPAPTNAPAANAAPAVTPPTEPPPEPAPVTITVTDQDHVTGSADAKVTIVEWSDFQCPFCGSFHPTMKQAVAAYGDKVRFVFRQFPLESIHPNARPAAEASECAAEQGKFWEYADKLFENQETLSTDLYKKLAKDLELDTAKFNDCVTTRKYQQHVTDDTNSGLATGVRGTPASYVNGVEVPGAVPFEQLKSYIDAALAK